MRKTIVIIAALLTGLGMAGGPMAKAAEPQKTEDKKGMTIEDLGRGLKSAGQNIEKEIPKIGPAIGETFKKVTGKGSDKQSEDKPAKSSK